MLHFFAAKYVFHSIDVPLLDYFRLFLFVDFRVKLVRKEMNFMKQDIVPLFYCSSSSY